MRTIDRIAAGRRPNGGIGRHNFEHDDLAPPTPEQSRDPGYADGIPAVFVRDFERRRMDYIKSLAVQLPLWEGPRRNGYVSKRSSRIEVTVVGEKRGRVFDSISRAAIHYGVNPSNLRTIIRRGKPAYGFWWKLLPKERAA